MMLTRFHKILIGMLVVQALLVVFVAGRSGRNSTATSESKVLPDFDPAKVARVQIFGSGATPPKPIDLVKKGDKWVLASGYDYPVDAKKVEDLLVPIGKMTAASPIGTKPSSHRQYKVADDEFERKLVITSEGGKDLTLFLGGPTRVPRRSAIRLGGDDNVHAVAGVSPFTASTEARGWITASYARGGKADITSITIAKDGGPFELKRIAEDSAGAGSDAGSGSDAPAADPRAAKWSVTISGAPLDLKPDEQIDNDTLDQIAGSVSDFDAADPGDPKRDASKPTMTITVVRKAGKIGATSTTTFDAIADGERFWLKQRDNDKAIFVDKSRLQLLADLKRDKLLKKPQAPPKTAEELPPGGGSGSAVVPPPPSPPGPGSGSN